MNIRVISSIILIGNPPSILLNNQRHPLFEVGSRGSAPKMQNIFAMNVESHLGHPLPWGTIKCDTVEISLSSVISVLAHLYIDMILEKHMQTFHTIVPEGEHEQLNPKPNSQPSKGKRVVSSEEPGVSSSSLTLQSWHSRVRSRRYWPLTRREWNGLTALSNLRSPKKLQMEQKGMTVPASASPPTWVSKPGSMMNCLLTR